MIKEIYGNICKGQEVRANLISLKKEIEDPSCKRTFAFLLAGDFSKLTALLSHEDAKVRKNAAKILGEMECEDVLPVLFSAYQKETTLFVRADYLKAMEKLHYRAYLGKLKRRQQELTEEFSKAEESAQKHLRQEASVLSRMILNYEKPQGHRFTGESASELLLICNRLHREVTARQIHTGKVTLFAGGVRVQDASLEEIRKIRTWQEMLFPLHGPVVRADTVQAAADTILRSDIFALLEQYHEGNGAFLFRLEYKGNIEQDKKGSFLRKLAALLEEGSGRRLINSTTDYEIEIRLVESKKGGCLPMLRFYTMQDKRFAYRRQFTSASIAPVNAALIMQIAKNYLQENAQVLDPCCGVGTMLIERNYLCSADPLYGVDIFGDAIEKARENSACARMPMHYINRDFFEFQHSYLFDEVVADLPPQADAAFYRSFVRKLEEVMKKDGILVLYNRNGALLEEVCRNWARMEICETAVLNERQNSLVVIGKMRL